MKLNFPCITYCFLDVVWTDVTVEKPRSCRFAHGMTAGLCKITAVEKKMGNASCTEKVSRQKKKKLNFKLCVLYKVCAMLDYS